MIELETVEDFHNLVLPEYEKYQSKIMAFDTETTGLNIVKDVPFLYVFGFGKVIFLVNLLNDNSKDIVQLSYDFMTRFRRVFAHNTKYDYHMMHNFGMKIPKEVKLADGYTVARLTNYADEQMSKSLEAMGTLYVDETAKFAGKVIKKRLIEIRAERKAEAKKLFAKKYPKEKFTFYWELLDKRVQFLETPYDAILDDLSHFYQEPNYLDVFNENPNLMKAYACDDVVILLEWLSKALPTLKNVDPDLRIFNQECDLITTVCDIERIGFKADIGYLLESRQRIEEYREQLYKELHEISGKTISVGQHKVIQQVFKDKWGIVMHNCDNKALKMIKSPESAVNLSKTIRELRTLDKWLSTYIDGMLNKVTDGRIYTSIDNAGAVSGRVSSNLQQQPKEPIYDRFGNELFHPRRAFITDDDYSFYFFDYSQQELRVQAYYTLLTSSGDIKLLRAYMPFNCISNITGLEFDYKDIKVLNRWDSGEWVDENGKIWTPTDVHTETTFTAFPFLNKDESHPEFKHHRRLGKMCNFLKNYQGGIDAIMEQLDVDEETAKILDRAYYATFPEIKKYQTWVTQSLHKHGFVENLYGRRHYLRNSKWFYKAGNYLVQGSCADMVKQVELKLNRFLEGTQSAVVMPVHDEVILRVHKDDEWIVPFVKMIMEDVKEVPYVPIVCEVEKTSTNWADKEEVHV